MPGSGAQRTGIKLRQHRNGIGAVLQNEQEKIPKKQEKRR